VAQPADQIALNGIDLISGTTGPFYVEDVDFTPPAQRQNWVRSADSEHSALVDPRTRYEDRKVTVKLRVNWQTTVSKDAAFGLIGLIQDQLVEGATLDWTPAGSTQTVTFRVLAGQITEFPVMEDGSDMAWTQNALTFTVELTCEPFGLLPEVATTPIVSSARRSACSVSPGTPPRTRD
jgi:hypothetical protein